MSKLSLESLREEFMGIGIEEKYHMIMQKLQMLLQQKLRIHADETQIIVGTIATILFIWFVLHLMKRSPFKYPYMKIDVDTISDEVKNWDDVIVDLFEQGKYEEIEKHEQMVQTWKEKCEGKIAKSVFRKKRRQQYAKSCDDKHAYRFVLHVNGNIPVKLQKKYETSFVHVKYLYMLASGMLNK